MATRKCPDCGEDIDSASVFCRFCGYNFKTGGAVQAARPATGSAINGTLVIGIIFIAIGAFMFFTTVGQTNRPIPYGVITMAVGVLNVVRGLARAR